MKLKQARERAQALTDELGYPHIVWVDQTALKIVVSPMGRGKPEGGDFYPHFSTEEVTFVESNT